jgi:glycosyltransferase involved in cell wall biosynthesis
LRVSVISTVLNEGEAIRRLMDSLAAQTRLPDEVVIVDGGSRDNTVAVIETYTDQLPLRVIVEPGANISRGRNVAIGAATGDIIASVDAGVWLEPIWLERLIAPFEQGSGGAREQGSRGAGETPSYQPSAISHPPSAISHPPSAIGHQPSAIRHQPSAIRHQLSAIGHPPSAVSGFFVADGQTTFEIAMGATVLPAIEDVKPAAFLPSSRSVAYTKEGWRAAGGYPEWLDYCEDLVFDLRLRDVAGPFGWAPEATAHFRPRGSLKTFVKQYYRYARGDGKADLWRKRHLIRYVTYLVALPALLLLGVFHNPWWLLVLLAGGMLYCGTPYRRLRPHLGDLPPFERVKAMLLVPVIRAAGDVAKMAGYPAGWVWRLKNWDRPEIHWQPDHATPHS